MKLPNQASQRRSPTTYRMPPDIEKKVTKLQESQEFDNLADIYSTALRYWFDNKDKKSQKELFKEWVVSEEGKAEVKQIIREIIDAEK